MAPKINNSAMALFLALNLLFFSMASATCGGGCPTPIPTPRSPSIPNPTPTTPQPTPTTPRSPSIPNPTPTTPQPTPPTPSTPQPTPTTPSTPNIPNPTPTTPNPTPTTPTTPSTGGGMCPIDALRLGVCADVLRSLLNLNIGNPPVQPCCSLINGLVDLDAAVCLCTAIRANILGINLNVPLSLSLLLNACNQNAPSGFQCP